MTAPRTLWLTNDLPPRSGGIEQFLANLLARGDPAGIRVLASNWPTAVDFDTSVAYQVRRVGRRPLLPTPALLARLRAEIAEHDPDVVVFGAAWPLGELAAALDRPCLALTHGHEAGLVTVGLGRLVRRVARSVDVLGVISDYTARKLAPWVDDVTAVRSLPPGVDTGRFRLDVDGQPVRAAYGLNDGRPVVLCLSRLVARKGQDVLVAGWPRVRAAVPGAHLVLAGEGPRAAPLRRQVERLALSAAVTFTGDIRAAALPGYHAAADVFAMPCRTRLRGLDAEGLGIVYLEAQACGKPVVAGLSGGAPEALVHGRSGVAVDGRDVAAVADAVSQLLGDRQRAAAMGRHGRAFVEERYAWERVAARFWDAVAEAARAQGPRRRRV